MTLDLALVTHRPEGIARVAAMQLPRVDGVRYIVSWQAHDNAPIPAGLLRPDVEVHRFDGTGISTNRNNVLDHCKADIILFADDDIIYFPDTFDKIKKVFEQHPEVDVATFRSRYHAHRTYPAESVKLHAKLPKNYFAASLEIALRRSTAGFLRCHPELGLGSPRLHGGEDEMFLMSAIRRGLECRFFPVTICEHPNPSTGTKALLTNENLQAAGCLIALTRPRTAILRLPLKAWRVSRARQASLPRAIYRLCRGAAMAPGVLRRGHQYLW